MFPYRVATLCAFPVAYALAGEAKRDFSFLFHLWRNIDQGRLPADRAPLFSRFPAARLCRARSPHSSHSDPRQIPYRCSCPAYPRTLDSSVSVLSAGRLQPSEIRLSSPRSVRVLSQQNSYLHWLAHRTSAFLPSDPCRSFSMALLS
jgi:hypothetical protein